MSDYLPTIGIECHVQLKTKTKLFSGIDNDARDAGPNSLISHICVGMPGALPVLNKKAVELASRAAYALNTKPQKFSQFERKHYFYPDLPKGYQITQYEKPIVENGWIEINVDGESKKINIVRAHIEEDAGKNTHPAGADYSLVDLNRAGTPLLEIVSAPDIKSAAEAKAYVRELWLAMRYAGVTDGDLYHGHMRFDVNVSLSKDASKLGTRTETKNLNSFKSVEAAIEYEINRQADLLDSGEKIVQETRGWDEAKQKTTSQRSKEEAEDYRYMPEPDVPPIVLDDDFDKEIEKQMPKLPTEIRQILSNSSISSDVIEDVLNVPKIYEKLENAFLLGATPEDIKIVIFNSLEEPASLRIDIKDHLELAQLLRTKQISSSAEKEILLAKLREPKTSIAELAKNKIQVSDESAIEKIVSEVLSENAKAAEDVKNGEMKAIGFLVGQVMAKSKGQANPQMAQELIKKALGI